MAVVQNANNEKQKTEQTEKGETVKRPPVKYFSTYPHGFSVLLQDEDANGEPVWDTDREGNGKVRRTKLFTFAVMPGKDPVTGKISSKHNYTMCLVDPKIHGDKWYDLLVKHLEKSRKNPDNRVFLEPDFIAHTNPVASVYEKKNRDLEKQLSEKDARIKALEEKMGFNK